MEDGRRGEREGERKRRRAEQVRQGRKEEARQSGRRKGRKEDARQGGGRKRGSPPRTKLKSRGCNSSDSVNIEASVRPCLTGRRETAQHHRGGAKRAATWRGWVSDESWPLAMRWGRGVFVRHRLRTKNRRFGAF